MDYKRKIAELIECHVQLNSDVIEKLIEIPPNQEMGDYAFACFRLSKIIKKAPNIVAEELKNLISTCDVFEKIDSIGPYINFFINRERFSEDIINQILEEGDDYGATNKGNGKTICIEYSSPNIAKHFHIGHLFSTVIGNALCKMFKKEGYNVIGINNLREWGIQFGKLMSGYYRWGDEEALEKTPIDELLRVYAKFHEEAEKSPDLEEEAIDNFKALENGKDKVIDFWKRIRELCFKEFQRIYNDLGVKFESLDDEAFFNDKLDGVFNELKEKELAVECNGVQVVMLKNYNMPPYIVSDNGKGLKYGVRDLAAAIYRKKTYNFHKCMYVLGNSHYFNNIQMTKVLSLAGYEWSDDCIPIVFGTIKFSERNGSSVLIDNLLDEAVKRTMEMIKSKEIIFNNEDSAKKIGIGAIIFNCLKKSREKDILFNWKEILSFERDAGPYVQFAYKNGSNMLTSIGERYEIADYRKLDSKEEFELVKLLANFNNVITQVLEKLEPSILASYVIEVANSFNKLYNSSSALCLGVGAVKAARLNLLEASLQVIKNGLELLGIDVVI